MLEKISNIFSARGTWFAIGVMVGMTAGLCIGFYFGFNMLYQSIQLRQIEGNFEKVKPGMTSGEAAKTIFGDVLIFPTREYGSPKREDWTIWGYDSAMMIDARKHGAYPFTLVIDKSTDKVISAGRVYNTSFD